ncbi:MAG: hypothetical protein ACR2J8_02090, partial [Thermomicrobiales bacterium]
VLAAGDLAFEPVNWLHYLTTQGDVPAKLALYHNAIPRGAIDLVEVLADFPPEVLASSFGLDREAFTGLAGGTSPIIAARVTP